MKEIVQFKEFDREMIEVFQNLKNILKINKYDICKIC